MAFWVCCPSESDSSPSEFDGTDSRGFIIEVAHRLLLLSASAERDIRLRRNAEKLRSRVRDLSWRTRPPDLLVGLGQRPSSPLLFCSSALPRSGNGGVCPHAFFSREPLSFPVAEDSVIVPIPVEDESVSSLSGILLDENYYAFIKAHRLEIAGVSILPTEALLLLKAKAWMDLTARKVRGEFVKDKDIRKHRTDILRLQAQIVEGTTVDLIEMLKSDLRDFLVAYAADPINPKTINVPGTFEDALKKIKEVFAL